MTKWGVDLDEDAGQLERLVNGVYSELQRTPVALDQLQDSIVALLSYLASPEGRTEENLGRVNMFFLLGNEWGLDAIEIPDEIRAIIEDIGGCLHDSISSPEVAENFESTPEQLLARIQMLRR